MGGGAKQHLRRPPDICTTLHLLQQKKKMTIAQLFFCHVEDINSHTLNLNMFGVCICLCMGACVCVLVDV